MRRITTTLLSLGLVAASLAACTSDEPDPSTDGDRDTARPAAVDHGDAPAFALPDDLELAATSLSGFDVCEEFLDHVTDAALEQVGPWGLGGGGAWAGEMTEDMAESADDSGADMDADVSAPVPGQDGAGPLVEGEDFSGTNVQEVGVDEPDRVKSDGATMYVVTEGRLRVLDITGDDPTEIGGLDLYETWDAQLLLDGDRLLLTSSTYGGVPFAGEPAGSSMPRGSGGGTTTMTLIDVTDPSEPEVLERLTVDGYTVSSRSVDGVARVVMSAQPDNLPWVGPEGSGLRAERAATDANRALVEGSEAADWIPYLVHETADGETTDRPLLACDRIARPEAFAGLGMLSVLTVDLSEGLLPGDEAVGVLAGGDTVYASQDRLYVATTRWHDWEAMDDAQRGAVAEDATTEIHAFDTSDPASTAYVASGTVPGNLLSQWSMSEHDGHLRVATTIGDTWWGGGFGADGEPSSSLVTVLEPQGGELAQVGQVDGLGPTERIYAVRFMGDVGYVVTFRETDPLYTLDLTDPTDPQVTGELKIMGYSAYLHPMGDDLLLGVGQDADDRGMTKGTQLSLFDVADPADPRRIDQVTLDDGSSQAEHDHHAFLHWPATGLTVVPFEIWSWDEETMEEDVKSGALSFTVSRDAGIEEVRTVSHLPLLRAELEDTDPDEVEPGDRLVDGTGATIEPDAGGTHASPEQQWLWDWGYRAAISRTMVTGDRVLTLSEAGVATHDLDTMEDLGWYRFGG